MKAGTAAVIAAALATAVTSTMFMMYSTREPLGVHADTTGTSLRMGGIAQAAPPNSAENPPKHPYKDSADPGPYCC